MVGGPPGDNVTRVVIICVAHLILAMVVVVAVVVGVLVLAVVVLLVQDLLNVLRWTFFTDILSP